MVLSFLVGHKHDHMDPDERSGRAEGRVGAVMMA